MLKGLGLGFIGELCRGVRTHGQAYFADATRLAMDPSGPPDLGGNVTTFVPENALKSIFYDQVDFLKKVCSRASGYAQSNFSFTAC